MVGSPQPIVATSGDSVVLPCHLEPSWNVEETVVEWTRQDPSHVKFVHVYRDHVEMTDMKTTSYRGRTALFTEELKHGNISLKLVEVTQADEGSYRCFLPTLRSPVKDSTVRLVIRECVFAGNLFDKDGGSRALGTFVVFMSLWTPELLVKMSTVCFRAKLEGCNRVSQNSSNCRSRTGAHKSR